MSGPWIRTDGVWPLPWLQTAWRTAVSQRGHALLLHGPHGVGQFELAAALAQTWLCEAPTADGMPCGRCEACHLLHAGSHPDLRVLAPAALRHTLGLEAPGEDDDSPSGSPDASGEKSADKGVGKAAGREIRVADVRLAIDWAHRSSSRARAKVLVLHPAQRLNPVAANALLKTLEEPPGLLRLVLSADDPQALLPTLRSRCQRVALTLPTHAEALQWLSGQIIEGQGGKAGSPLGEKEALTLLQAAGGRPQEARALAQDGVSAALWPQLPSMVRQGRTEALAGLPVPRIVDTLQKICLDLLARALGAPPTFFSEDQLPPGAQAAALSAWWARLQKASRHEDHPWNAGLLTESLVLQGRQCWMRDRHVR